MNFVKGNKNKIFKNEKKKAPKQILSKTAIRTCVASHLRKKRPENKLTFSSINAITKSTQNINEKDHG